MEEEEDNKKEEEEEEDKIDLAVHADAEMISTRMRRNMTIETLAATAGGRSGRGRTLAAAAAMLATTAAKDRPTGVALVKDPCRARRGQGFICRSFVPGWGALLAKQHRLSYVITRSFCGRSKVGHTDSGRFKRLMRR